MPDITTVEIYVDGELDTVQVVERGLQGPVGATGPTGAQGPQGPVGDVNPAMYTILAGAQSSEAAAAASAASASASAAAAAASEGSAASSASSGSASAATAATKANEAAGSAAAALASEQSIVAKVNQAEQARIDAIAYAAVAEEKADEIVASANAAAADASAADADRIAAEAARTGAEAAQAIAQGAAAGALASEVAADASADVASGAAASALSIYGSVDAQNTAVAVAQAQASLAAGFAASAASVAQQDLSGVTAQALHRSPNAVTAIFIYDTSKDSDGGAWTEKCQHTSWWNEAIFGKWLGAQASETAARAVSGATTGDYFQRTSDGRFYSLNAGSGITEVFRGNKRDFPRLAGIVAEASSVTIYDLTEPGRPMWMRFATNTSSASMMALVNAGNNLSAVAAREGLIVVGGGGSASGWIGTLVDFVSERIQYAANGVAASFAGNIASRNSALGRVSHGGYGTLNGLSANAVAVTVLRDAPIDPVTGLRVPTIAVGSNSTASIIRHDGVVVNIAAAVGWPHNVIFDRRGSLWEFSTGVNGGWGAREYYGKDFGSFVLYSGYNNQIPNLNNSVNDFQVGRYVSADKYLAGYWASTPNQASLFRPASPNKERSLTGFIRDTFNTGWMTGDIRRCFLSDTGAGSVTGAELVTNGTFDTDLSGWENSGSWAWSGGSAVTTGSFGSLSQTIGARNSTKRITLNYTKTQSRVQLVALDSTGANASLGLSGATADIANLGSSPVSVIMPAGYDRISFVTTDVNALWSIDNISVREFVPDRSYKGQRASIFGTLTRAQLASGTSLVGFSGFSGANYLREPYSADLDFGTGEWTGSAWANIPAALPISSFPASGPELVSNGTFDANTTGWTSAANGIVTWSSGRIRVERGDATTFPRADQVITGLTVGRTYRLSGDLFLPSGVSGGINISATFDNWRTASGTIEGFFVATATSHTVSVVFNSTSGAVGAAIEADNISVREVGPAVIFDRAAASGARLRFGITGLGRLTAEASDGTTTRTVTTSAAYNTAQWLKARINYTTDGTLAILVNGREVAATRGAPLLTLNNASAVLTIGNSFALDAPFPGSIALLKLGATVPTPEQATFMFEQEKQLFRSGALSVLPDSGALVDMAYDDATDRWVAMSATNESYWTGLVRNSVQAVPAGSFSRVVAGSGLELAARTGTNPGVDVTIPAYGLREELVRRAEAAARLTRELLAFDFVGGFTANTTNGSAAITNVAGLTYPGTLIGARVSGAGIPANTRIVGVSGTTIYLSAVCTATATGVSISFLDFNLPVAFEARAVLSAGALRREGSTADYTRLYDGFLETIRFAVAPGATAWVQIQATRGTMQ